MFSRTKLPLWTFWLFLICVSQTQAMQTVEVYGTTMGKIKYSVIVVAADDLTIEKQSELKATVDGSLQRVNDLMSTYLDDSDVSKFNRSDSTDWQPIDPETAAVISRALEICELTQGAFDPTVGPAVNAWNFGPNKEQKPSIPDAERIIELKSMVGYQLIEVRANPPSIRKLNTKVQLDLSAIAKGYAVDRVGKSLEELGYKNFMVEVGGEVTTRGERSQGGPWKIAIENPDTSLPPSNADRIHRVVKLSGKAVATSGDYRNYFEFDGKRYSHTIDPKTCKPVEHDLAIASVVADDCMTADALATAVMVMGAEEGSKLCKEHGYPLLTVIRANSGNGLPYVTFNSPDFPVVKNVTPAEPVGTAISEAKSDEADSESILPVFLATFFVFCLFVLGMAVGAIFNNKPVTGSCGGIANMKNEDGEDVCGICSKPTTDCTEPVEA